jgi:hypothetical protein
MRGDPFFSSKFLIAAAALIGALGTVPARAQINSVGGRLVLPVDEDCGVECDDEADATLKSSVRSQGGELGRAMQRAIQNGSAFLPAGATPVSGSTARGQGPGGGTPGPNTQVNDPGLDHVQTFDPAVVVTRPFEFSTQSETSVINHGQNVVVGYNSSAGAVVEFFPGFGLAFTQLLLSAFSTSHDGGATWKSGFLPPASPASPFTFGDPALASDGNGNIVYSSLGTAANGTSSVNVNISTDNGDTWTAAIPVAVQGPNDGFDKDWIAIGPDPQTPSRDNVYVTWTNFVRTGGSQLWFSRSTDGGLTWSSPRVLFAPVDDGVNSAFIQSTNPVVDPSNGRVYVPFLHFSDADADNVRLLVSDDGGANFRFIAFNFAGAVDAFAFPNVTPGAINDCTGGGFRVVLHQGPSQRPGRIPGTFMYAQATRLFTQPNAAVVGGRIVIVVNSSTSPTFGDPSAGSVIRVLYSKNGGGSWAAPFVVAPSTAATPNHVHPSITLDAKGLVAYVGYYAQGSDERLRTEIARVQLTGNHLTLRDVSPLSSTSFDLTPSNVIRIASPVTTTNYDRTVVACYDIGEYMSVQAGSSSDNAVSAAWGDNRNSWTGPPGSPAPFTHAQPDVFFSRLSRNGN